MPTDIKLRCECGALEGVIKALSPKAGGRVTCYCTDCQAFAENLACVKVTDKGILRWHAACCRTPIGNTLGSRNFSFVGLIAHCLKDTTDGQSLATVIGPSNGAVHIKDARGKPADVAAASVLALTFKIAARAWRTPFRRPQKNTLLHER